ncbi:MAG: prohibitin family protein [Solirubrobacterales bacterium]
MSDNDLVTELKAPSTVSTIFKWTGIVIGAILLLTVFRPFVVVGPGERGVVTRFGKVQKEVMGEGLHWRTPIYEKVTIMDVKVQKEEIDANAVSKDLQTVSSKVALNFHIAPEATARLFQQVGLEFPNRIIAPAMQESIKAVTANYTAEELVTKREMVAVEIRERISDKIQPYGLRVDALNMTNFDFSVEFNAAIEQKQVAEQNALKAKRDLDRIKVEAEQQIATARAEAEAFKLKSQQLTPMMIEMEKIKKWNGKYPDTMVVTGDKGAVPIISLPK